jgi:VWFA-related protein
MRIRGLAGLIVLTALAALAQQADTSAATRCEFKRVMLDAVVTDRKGNYVPDLPLEDFKLSQDGARQPIRYFAGAGAAAKPASAEVQYTVVFLDLASAPSGDQPIERQAAQLFVEANAGPNHYVAIVGNGSSPVIVADFTADAARLRRSVGAVGVANAEPEEGETLIRDDDAERAPQLAADFATVPASTPALRLLAALRAVAEGLERLPGRKTLVLFASGSALSVGNSGAFPQLRAALNASTDACNKARVAVYLIDVHGLAVPGPSTPREGSPDIHFGEGNPNDPPTIDALAGATGGFQALRLLGGIERIVQEQRQHYVIGYTPPESASGGCHFLAIKVSHAGYAVRARNRDCSLPPVVPLAATPAGRDLERRASSDAAATIQGALMQTPFFYRSPNAARLHLALEIPSHSIRFTRLKGRQHADIDILGLAFNPSGAVAARFGETLKLDLSPDQLAKFLDKPFMHYDTQVDLAAGVYDLKVSFDSGGERFGKLEKNPLTIDPYDGKSLFLSGIAFGTDFHRGSAATDAGAPLVTGDMRITPSGSNRFKTSDAAVCYVEVYLPPARDASDPAAGVSAELRLLDAKTGEERVATGGMDLDGLAHPGNPAVPLSFHLDLDSLTAGQYVAEVRATDSDHHVVTRQAPFEVIE